jgi:hypothetical protein
MPMTGNERAVLDAACSKVIDSYDSVIASVQETALMQACLATQNDGLSIEGLLVLIGFLALLFIAIWKVHNG